MFGSFSEESLSSDLFQSLISSVTEGSAASYLRQGMAILPAQNFRVSSSYLELVQTKYRGSTQSLAYTSPLEARDTINRWAQDQSGDQVKEFVDALDPQTQLLLTTTTYRQSMECGGKIPN